MATVLEVFTTEEQRSIVPPIWLKGAYKDIFPVYGGKCLSR
jgi:hypothetical protein